jgi:hypothetical protein
MNRLVHVLVALVTTVTPACVSQTEIMRKDGRGGDSYVYHYGQIGGQGTGQSSMGTAVAFDGQKSLSDLIQGAVAKFGLDYQEAKVLSDNLTRRYELGQITIQQRDALQAALATSTSAQQFELAMAQILR